MPKLLHASEALLPQGFTGADLYYAQELYRGGVLTPIQDTSLREVGRAISCSCSDCDRSCDTLDQFRVHIKRDCRGRHNLHQVHFAGVTLRFTSGSPVLKEFPIDAALSEEMRIGHHEKDCNFCIFCTHWPCGAALLSKVDFRTSLMLFSRGKRAVLEQFPNLEVASFLDLDTGAYQLTYKFSTTKFFELYA